MEGITREMLAEMGARVKAERKAREWTIDELGQRADISAQFLGHVERGTRKMSLDTLYRLCKAMGVDPTRYWAGSLGGPINRAPGRRFFRGKVSGMRRVTRPTGRAPAPDRGRRVERSEKDQL